MSGALVALLLGLRHGIDPDHIAAISDIAALRPTARRTLRQAFAYACGHALIVLGFVAGVTALGASLPEWATAASSWLVGSTLIILGAWVLIGLVTGDGQARSRWSLVAGLVRWLRFRRSQEASVHHEHEHDRDTHGHVEAAHEIVPQTGHTHTLVKHRHAHSHDGRYPSSPAPFLIGMAHGFGAETPTQIALLASAAEATTVAAVKLGAVFVAGLIISNMAVAAVAAIGATGARRSVIVGKGLTLVAGVASIYVGATALFG